MLRDKLDSDERIRLEALNQAVQSIVVARLGTTQEILARAERFESYIRGSLEERQEKAVRGLP